MCNRTRSALTHWEKHAGSETLTLARCFTGLVAVNCRFQERVNGIGLGVHTKFSKELSGQTVFQNAVYVRFIARKRACGREIIPQHGVSSGHWIMRIGVAGFVAHKS